MKRNDIKRRPLADTVLASLEPEAKEYRETYGVDRIYFVVSPNGRKRWELRYKKPSGSWSFMGLGGYPEVSAKRAREKASQVMALVDQGVDPVAKKVSDSESDKRSLHTTFRAAAEAWHHKRSNEGLAKGTLEKIRTYLDKDILPALGDKQLDAITRRDCAELQRSFERREAFNVASKARGWVNKIFSFAIASGLTENNPASELLVVAAPAPKMQQYPHLLEPELGDFMRAMRKSPSRLVARTAAWMTLWTASRPGMVRYAEWSEIDLDAGLWSIPGEKMKTGRDHVVPLCTQLVTSLRELHELTGRNKWLFPGIGPSTPVISENTIGKVFAGVGYKGRLVGHGTRHTASTLLREHEWNKDFVEAQLAHKEAGVSGVYNKAAYLRQRQKMMQWYADYLDALSIGISAEEAAVFKERVG